MPIPFWNNYIEVLWLIPHFTLYVKSLNLVIAGYIIWRNKYFSHSVCEYVKDYDLFQVEYIYIFA